MKTNRIHRNILIAAIVALVGFSGIAIAGAYGPGQGMRGAGAYGDCPRYHDGRAGRGAANLSDEQIAQMDKLRTDFYKATADLRADLRQKELSLEAELAKKEPDTARARALQTEISSLRAELDAKRLAHRLEMNKVAPDAGYGAGPHHGRGGGFYRR